MIKRSYFNPIQDGGEGQKGLARKYSDFRFDPFTTPLQSFKAILSASPSPKSFNLNYLTLNYSCGALHKKIDFSR